MTGFTGKIAMRRLAILPIRLYQWTLSPLLPRSCRFAPSCSEYAADAVLAHGLWRGLRLAGRRLGGGRADDDVRGAGPDGHDDQAALGPRDPLAQPRVTEDLLDKLC